MGFLALDVALVLALFAGLVAYPALRKRRLLAEPPMRRRWALALADIQLRRQGLPHLIDTLQFPWPDEGLASLRRGVLTELGIDPDAPAGQVDASVRRALSNWAHGLGTDRIAFFSHMCGAGRARDALALECARTAFVVRCLARLGLCPEDTAWLILLLNAQRAQDTFQGWAEFGLAYARGRHTWVSGAEQGSAPQRTELEVREYLNDRHGNWAKLPWNAYRLFDPQPLPQAAQPAQATR